MSMRVLKGYRVLQSCEDNALYIDNGTECLPLKGASSWNDLKDRPFGGEKIVSLGDTLTFPEQTPTSPSDVFVRAAEVDDVVSGVRYVSESTPSLNELIGGTTTSLYGTTVVSEDMVLVDTEVLAVMYSGSPIFAVALADNALVSFMGTDFLFPKKGFYISCALAASAGMYINITRSITLHNYNFTETVVQGIDPVYLPEGGVGYIEENPTIFPETVLSGVPDASNVYLFPLEFKIEVGEAYDVTIDGVTTTCVAKVLNPNQTPTTIILGNARVLTTNFDYEDTGEDFGIADRFLTLEQNVLVSSTKSYPETVTVSIKQGVEKVHKIDEKFLPETGLVISLDEEQNPLVTAAEFIDAIENNRPMVLRAHIKNDSIIYVFNVQSHAAVKFGDLYAASFICPNPLGSTGSGAESVMVYKIVCRDKETFEIESKTLILPAVYADNGTTGYGRPQYLYQRKVDAAIDYGLTDRIMMYSPNGTMYYITVSDDGTLSASKS